MSVSFGAQTGLVLVDARPQAGRCYLPLSQTLLGRTVTIKDQFGVAAVSSIQVLTNSPDTFEDGTTSRWITHGYGFMTISATASNVWTVVGGTRQPSFQASTISTFFVNTQSISSFQSAVSQEVVSTLSAGTAYIGTISTANLAAPSPLFSTAQLLDTGTGTYQTVSLSSSFLYINNTAAPTIVIPTQLVSTVAGLGTTNYISTLSLNSTIAGLGTATYVSSPSLTSSLLGLGSIGYVSSLSMTSSIISTVAGLGTASFISSLSLTSSLVGLGNAGFISSATLLSTAAGLTSNISSLIDPVELTSTIVGMGAVGFISTIGLTSTVQGLGTVGFISTATLVSTVFGLRAETSTVAATAFTGSTVSLSAGTIYVSSFKTSVLNASTAIVAWNGSAAPTNYGLAVDTLTLQTTNAGYGAGIASMAFATATAAYPLARIYALDSATSGSAVSQLVFQTAPINSTTFNSAFVYTGSLQTFTVPAGVTSINIQIWGAGGGGGMGTSTPGGAGAYITGLLAVTPGQVLSLIVGGPGTYSTPTVKPFGGGGGGSANGNVASGGGRSAIQFSPAGITLTAATSSGTAITYTTSGSYGIPNGSFVTVTGFTSTSFNISGAISVISGTQFSILSSLAAATATGTGLVYQELINAAGGGGGGGVAGNQSAGGYGGILTGGAGVIIAGTAGAAGGATQTAGGAGGVGSGDTGATGLFFMGASGVNGAGGGGGLYGGGAGGGISGGYGAAGGGGSSYISNSAFTYSATSAQSTGQAAPFTGTGYISGVAAGGNYASSGGGGLIVITNPPGGSMSEAMRIGTTGNVGIGTAAPAALLDVAGTSRAQTASTLTMNTSSLTVSQKATLGSATIGGATVNLAGLLTSNTYGTGSDTLTIQTTSGGTSGGVASLYFGTPTYGYPLGRIAALDTGSTYDTSALIFQNATVAANSAASGANTFTYTGSAQSYTVPAGVTSITVKMWGAGGANQGGSGGAGAYLTGSLAVTPGQVLSLIVGQAGRNDGISSGTYGGGGSATSGYGSGGGRSAIQATLSVTVTGVVGNGTTATLTTSGAHGLITGEPVLLSGLSGYSGTYAVASVPTPTTFTIASSTSSTLSGQSGTIVAELVDVGGGGGGGSFSGGGNGNATYTGSAAASAGVAGGGGGTQTAGGAAGGGSGTTAGSLLQGGASAGISYARGGGGGGYYGGGGGYADGTGAGGGGGGSSWSGLLTSVSGANSSDGNSPPGTGVPGYISGVARGGAASAAGPGLVIIVVPLAYNLAESMRISNNGYLGIGTTTPGTQLDVAGVARASTTITGVASVSSLAIYDSTTPSTGSLYQISSVLYYNNTAIGGVTAASIQAFTF